MAPRSQVGGAANPRLYKIEAGRDQLGTLRDHYDRLPEGISLDERALYTELDDALATIDYVARRLMEGINA